MPNGNVGSFSYFDESYSGSGDPTTAGSPLSGGLGDLTDALIALDNWFVVEAPAGAGPYVGWTVDPTIVFRFAAVRNFTTLRIHFDDADGNGGVSAPSGVVINGTSYSVTDPAGSAPFWASFDVTGLSTDTLTVNLQRNNIWVFASEFEFSDGAQAIPEPSTALLSLVGLLGVAGWRVRRAR